MFNGIPTLMYAAGIGALIENFLVSWSLAGSEAKMGIKSALFFAAPALLFALFSLGDLIANGNQKAFLFWFAAGVLASSAGFVGVFTRRRLT